MNRLRRSLIILALSVIGTLAAGGYRTLDAFGFFITVEPGFAGTCAPVSTVLGAEDIAIDPKTRLAFFSVIGGAQSRASVAAGGLYVFLIDHPERGVTKLTGTPRDFHPRGISLYRAGDDGPLTLMAINRPTVGEPRIEVFDVRAQSGRLDLVQTTSITSGLLVDPFGIAAAGKAQFYVTNALTSRTWLGRLLEIYAMLPRANVVYFDGNSFRVVAENLNVATGIRLSRDGAHAYVAAATGRALNAFAVDRLSGAFIPEGKLPLPAAPEHIDVDADGTIWAAAEPKLRIGDPSQLGSLQPIPSEILEITESSGVPTGGTVIYADAGKAISAASAVGVAGKRFFIGSSSDPKILACTLGEAP